MRVLHIHSGNLFGGVETFLLTLARCSHLVPGMHMTAALCFEGEIAVRLRSEGIPVRMLGAVRLRRPDAVWRARRSLTALLAEEHFDVVVCHQAWPLAILGPVVKRAGLPLVAWIHVAQDGKHWLEKLAARVEPDCYVCNSRFTASVLPRCMQRVEVIHYPVAPVPEAAARNLNGGVVITQVSRMEPWKGQRVLIQALAELKQQPGWMCWLVGGAQRRAEATYQESLRADVKRLDLDDRVSFLGERRDVPALLASSDIFCQANLEPEPFGIAFVEALSAGLPVVASALGGALEIVDDSCGALVAPDNPTALAAALARLIGNRWERDRLGHGGPARAKKLCDPERQMRRIAALLEDVADVSPALTTRVFYESRKNGV